ncbi:MAG: hypothetical protein R2909_05145 [Gemmatimonadales bacterium]
MLPLALLLWQVGQGSIAVAAQVDRAIVPVGDEVRYTLRATTTETGPIRIELPTVHGLEVVEQSERTDPVLGRPGAREYALELVLRAAQIGRWRYGPVLVFVGGAVEFAPEVDINIVGTSGRAGAPASNPRLLELIRSVPRPSGSGATLRVVVSRDRVVRGEQLDVLTVAWFPRSVRSRLRRPPTLKPPVLGGVWSVPQPAIPGVLASWSIGDDVYDLFVSHQVVFPLAAGPLEVPPARVEYAVPSSRRSTSAERPVEVVSEPVAVTVVEPPGDRPAGFNGPVAGDLQIGYRLRQLPARAGELVPVDVTLSGRGNLAFWSPPAVEWPDGLKAYLDGVDEAPDMVAGFLGGTKTFRFLLLPDSVGSVALPGLDYAYYDARRDAYREATATGLVIPVLEGSPTATRPTKMPLVEQGRDLAEVTGRLRPFGPLWWLLALSVPAILAGVTVLARRRRAESPAALPRQSAVEALERSFMVLAPGSGDLSSRAVADELRRAGVEPALADELVSLRGEVDRIRFGPEPGQSEAGLGQTVGKTLSRLPKALRRRLGLAALLAAGLATPAAGQADSAAALYEAGSYGLAAIAFRARVDPTSSAWRTWYNLAAAEYMAGRDAEAAAALFQALRRAPRASAAQELWQALERGHEPLRRARMVVPLSRSERWLVVLVLGWVAAVAVALRSGRRRLRHAALAVFAASVVAAVGLDRAAPDGDGFTTGSVGLRVAPHGVAQERGSLPGLALVHREDERGDWVLVRDQGGARGWILKRALAPLGRLD